ncbi:hypothetical protein SLA2020_142720 [Shorea laevis]
MTGRTFLMIFFFWAALTVITPTLVLWSESSKPDMELNGEKSERLKDRKLIGYPEACSRNATVSSNQLETAAPVPAPAPATELDLALMTRKPAEQSLLESNNTSNPPLLKPK